MWDPKTQKPKLCDFDLSHLCEKPERGVEEVGPDGPTGFSNTGTWIFMAAELLSRPAMAGKVKRVYRHEVEAFIAVLVWILCRYQDGKLRASPPLGHWIHTSYVECKERRGETFGEIMTGTFPQPTGIPEDIWVPLCMALVSMRNHSGEAVAAQYKQATYKRFVAYDPSYAFDVKSPEDYNALRALPKILTWPIFKNEAAQRFIGLVDGRILKPLGLKLEVARPST
jgi:hypothetical protein